MDVAPITIRQENKYQSKESCVLCLDASKNVMVGHYLPEHADVIHLVCRKCFDALPDPKHCPQCEVQYIEGEGSDGEGELIEGEGADGEDERIERPRELAMDIHDIEEGADGEGEHFEWRGEWPIIEVEGARPAVREAPRYAVRPEHRCYVVSSILTIGVGIGIMAGVFAANFTEPQPSISEVLIEYLGYGAAAGLASSLLVLPCINWERR